MNTRRRSRCWQSPQILAVVTIRREPHFLLSFTQFIELLADPTRQRSISFFVRSLVVHSVQPTSDSDCPNDCLTDWRYQNVRRLFHCMTASMLQTASSCWLVDEEDPTTYWNKQTRPVRQTICTKTRPDVRQPYKYILPSSYVLQSSYLRAITFYIEEKCQLSTVLQYRILYPSQR